MQLPPTSVIITLLVLIVAGSVGAASAAPTLVGDVEVRTKDNSSSAGRLPILGEGGIDAAKASFNGDLIHVRERDSIRSLSDPAIIRGDMDRVLSPDDDVIGVRIGDKSRAYPLRVMMAHEVVNDSLGGTPLVVTFCPLCYSGVTFDRRVNGHERHFGVSGVLLNSDLVLFDRESESLWNQILGEAVAGPDVGQRLIRIPSVQTSWIQWLEAYPDTEVIDVESMGGNSRYPAERFSAYYRSQQTGLYPVSFDQSLDSKALVLGIVIGGEAHAYPLTNIAQDLVYDEVGSIALLIVGDMSGARAFLHPGDGSFELAGDGRIIASRQETWTWSSLSGEAVDAPFDLEPVEGTLSFWYAWSAFYPDTQVFEP